MVDQLIETATYRWIVTYRMWYDADWHNHFLTFEDTEEDFHNCCTFIASLQAKPKDYGSIQVYKAKECVIN